MQFIVKKDELCNAISHVSKGVSVKSTIPALEGICIQMAQGSITLTGYDLEIGIRTCLQARRLRLPWELALSWCTMP